MFLGREIQREAVLHQGDRATSAAMALIQLLHRIECLGENMSFKDGALLELARPTSQPAMCQVGDLLDSAR